MKNDTSWGEVAQWYDGVVEGDDSYQQKVIAPNLMRLLALKEGERILDLACGQGFFARTIAETGAQVFGVDISKELVAVAKQKGTERIEYHVAPAHKLDFLKEQSVEKGICVLALQNMENYQEVLREVSRVLVDGGKFYLVLNHPAFRIPKESEWGYDEEKGVQYRRLDRYISEGREEIEMHPGKQSKEVTVSFHRPLQSYFKAFEKAGFAVTRMEEWMSHRKSDSGPRAKAENRARGEFPLFACFELVKKG